MAFLLPQLRVIFNASHLNGFGWTAPAAADVQPLREPKYIRIAVYFGGGGVKISRFEGSGFGFGLGAFFASFLPLSLLPMRPSMTQLRAAEKCQVQCRISFLRAATSASKLFRELL